MTKFVMGLLLGLILGIGGTAAFLISAQGGDYLVATSPRVRDLESSLRQADQEREWLRGQLRDANDVLTKLESRFVALATRFDDLGSHAAALLGAPEASPAVPAEPSARTAAPGEPSARAAAPTATPTTSPRPRATPTAEPTPTLSAPDASGDPGKTGAGAGSPRGS
jgi:hypothetical protein